MRANWQTYKFKQLYTLCSDQGHADEELLSVYLNKGVIRYSDSDGAQVHKPSDSLEKYQLVQPSFLVLNNQQAWRGSAGVSRYRGIVSPAYHVYKPVKGLTAPRFMNYFSRTVMVPAFEQCSHGVGSIQRPLSKQELKDETFSIPPLDEQCRIADYLDARCADIDAAVDAAEKSIDECTEYRRSYIADAVMGRITNSTDELVYSENIWLGMMPRHWEIRRTKYCFKIVKDIAGYEGPDVLAVTNAGIKIKKLTGKGQFANNYSNYQWVHPGDFIMNNLDLVTGWVDCTDLEGVTSPDYRVFRAVSPGFWNGYYRYVFQALYLCRVYRDVANVADGAGWGRLQRRIFENFMLPVPPLNEQHAIGSMISRELDSLTNVVQAKQSIIADLKAYKQSLVYEVVTGKREVS